MESSNTNPEVPNEVLHILSQPPKKPTGKRQSSRESSVEETASDRASDGSSSISAPATTTTTTTTTEAPKHPKALLPNPVDTQYTVDGDKETTRTIVDFFPDLPSAASGRETETPDTQTAPEETQKASTEESGRKKRRKNKKKKAKEYTVTEEEPPTEYLDEGVEPQDYQNYLYGFENPEDSSTEAEGVEDLFPDGLPEGYPTDRFRPDGNYTQNTR